VVVREERMGIRMGMGRWESARERERARVWVCGTVSGKGDGMRGERR